MHEIDYLMHYGMPRRSGRYPWGSGDRPYQGDGISVKKSSKSKRGKLSAKKLNPEQYEAAKAKAIKSGSARDILRFKGDLTEEELRKAVARIQYERKLMEASIKEIDEGWNAIDRAFKKVGNVKDWLKAGSEFYDVLEDIIN